MEKNGKDKKKYEAPAIVLLGELATAIGVQQTCTNGTGAQGNCRNGDHATGGTGGCSEGNFGIPCKAGLAGNP